LKGLLQLLLQLLLLLLLLLLRLAACGLRLAACGLRLGALIESPAQVRSLRGVRLLHHLADSGQGFPADSQRGAIAQAIDAKTPRISHAPSKNQQDGKSALSKGRCAAMNTDPRPAPRKP